jgi:iron-sulfur cluster assembly accessory protein
MSTAESTPTITLTDAAIAKITALIAEEGEEQALRIAVTGGGCSGFQYALGFDNEQGGVKVYVDQTSAEYLSGAHVDFQDGLQGKGFAIENPNSTGSCGCGQSFSC